MIEQREREREREREKHTNRITVTESMRNKIDSERDRLAHEGKREKTRSYRVCNVSPARAESCAEAELDAHKYESSQFPAHCEVVDCELLKSGISSSHQ